MSIAIFRRACGQHINCSQGGKAMGNAQRLRTHTGNPDWHGWLPLQPYRSTAFQLAVVIFLAVPTFIAVKGVLVAAQTGITRPHDHPGIGAEAVGPHWSGLVGSMMKIHDEMSAIERTGDADADFVRLMLPHHQAAVDMARVQLLHGKDPQMRRLAQEILADQQLEIELMQLWLTQQPVSSVDANITSPVSE
jgi:Domain of unknown function (DUF305)